VRDADILAEALGEANAQVKALEKEVEATKERMSDEVREANTRANNMERKLWFHSTLSMLFWLALGLGVGSAGGYPIYKYLTTQHRVSHCYIEHKATQKSRWFELVGHVPWHMNDVDYGSYPTFDEAVKKARAIKCPIDVEKNRAQAEDPDAG
jgi:hypothetical protein